MIPSSQPAPAADDLLPAHARVQELRELMSPEELRELYLLFADRVNEAVTLLRKDPAQLGKDDVEMCVHDIKGTAATLGLDRVASSAAVVLQAARTTGPAEAHRLSGDLVPLLERLPDLLRGEVLQRLIADPPG